MFCHSTHFTTASRVVWCQKKLGFFLFLFPQIFRCFFFQKFCPFTKNQTIWHATKKKNKTAHSQMVQICPLERAKSKDNLTVYFLTSVWNQAFKVLGVGIRPRNWARLTCNVQIYLLQFVPVYELTELTKAAVGDWLSHCAKKFGVVVQVVAEKKRKKNNRSMLGFNDAWTMQQLFVASFEKRTNHHKPLRTWETL